MVEFKESDLDQHPSLNMSPRGDHSFEAGLARTTRKTIRQCWQQSLTAIWQPVASASQEERNALRRRVVTVHTFWILSSTMFSIQPKMTNNAKKQGQQMPSHRTGQKETREVDPDGKSQLRNGNSTIKTHHCRCEGYWTWGQVNANYMMGRTGRKMVPQKWWALVIFKKILNSLIYMILEPYREGAARKI